MFTRTPGVDPNCLDERKYSPGLLRLRPGMDAVVSPAKLQYLNGIQVAEAQTSTSPLPRCKFAKGYLSLHRNAWMLAGRRALLVIPSPGHGRLLLSAGLLLLTLPFEAADRICRQWRWRSVLSLERIGALVSKARRTLQSLKLGNVRLKHGDGSADLKEDLQVDAIIVTAGATHVPTAKPAGAGIPGGAARRMSVPA